MKSKGKTIQEIIKIIPLEKPFAVGEIAHTLYPYLTRYDSEGRKFNRGCATTARLLRQIKGIQEGPLGMFYAHKEYFQKVI